MNLSQGRLQYLALLLMISLCLIGQVSSTKCYSCDSELQPECISAANLNESHVINCPTNPKNNALSGIFNTLDKAGKPIPEFQCGSVKGVFLSDGKTYVGRGCIPKYVSCDTYKVLLLIQYSKQIDNCQLCDSDRCNSSSHLNVGFFSLSFALLTLYLVKL